MSLLNHADWLSDMLGSDAGIAIDYTRGATTIAITAESGDVTVGRRAASSDRDGGARKEWLDRDYLIRETALASLDVPTPVEGDLIRETVNGTTRSYKVFRPDTGVKAWEWADTEEVCFRVHVKLVG